ncbi:MAG: hypothetical protein ACI8PB_005495 [Desulforhopalus sp.]|jgi:hypothetical protein
MVQLNNSEFEFEVVRNKAHLWIDVIQSQGSERGLHKKYHQNRQTPLRQPF